MSFKTSGYKSIQQFRKIRNEQKARYRERTGSGKYNRQAWTDEEDEKVMAHKEPDRELAEELHRSVVAIQGRRYMLKKWMKRKRRSK